MDGVLASGRRDLSLNELADMVIGKPAIGHGEIELLIDALEAEGIEVGEQPAVDPQDVLGAVLTAARTLRDKLGRAPTAEEIGALAGVDALDVKRALEYGRTLAKPRD